jgi:hypothetical protein
LLPLWDKQEAFVNPTHKTKNPTHKTKNTTHINQKHINQKPTIKPKTNPYGWFLVLWLVYMGWF